MYGFVKRDNRNNVQKLVCIKFTEVYFYSIKNIFNVVKLK